MQLSLLVRVPLTKDDFSHPEPHVNHPPRPPACVTVTASMQRVGVGGGWGLAVSGSVGVGIEWLKFGLA